MFGRARDPNYFRGEIASSEVLSLGCIAAMICGVAMVVWGIFVAGFDIYPELQSIFRGLISLPDLHWAIRYPLDLLLWPLILFGIGLAGRGIEEVLAIFFPRTIIEFDGAGIRIRKRRNIFREINWNDAYKCRLYRGIATDDEELDDEEVTAPDTFPAYAVIKFEQKADTISVTIPYFPTYVEANEREELPVWKVSEGTVDFHFRASSPGAAQRRALVVNDLLTRCGYPPRKAVAPQ